MAFTVLRVSAVLLVAVLVLPAVPDAAERLNNADAQDFQMFRNTISVRRNARLCERSVPGYSETFEGLYATWSETRDGPRRAGAARAGVRPDFAGRADGGGVRKAPDVPEAMIRIS